MKEKQEEKNKPKVKSTKNLPSSKENKNDTIFEIQEVNDNQSIIVNFNGNRQQFNIPEDFAIDESGSIFHLVHSKNGGFIKKQISDGLVFISSIIKDNETEKEKVEIVIFKNKKFTTKIFQRSQIYSYPLILSDFGVTVLKDNSEEFVRYLVEFENCNNEKIQLKKSINRVGWLNENKEFSPWIKEKIDSNSEILDGYTEKGTLNDWVESFKPFRKNPLFRFVLASSFSASLLRVLKERSFVINIVAPSRSRKNSNFSSQSFCMAVITQN